MLSLLAIPLVLSPLATFFKTSISRDVSRALMAVGVTEGPPFGPLLVWVRTNSSRACSSRFLISRGRTIQIVWRAPNTGSLANNVDRLHHTFPFLVCNRKSKLTAGRLVFAERSSTQCSEQHVPSSS